MSKIAEIAAAVEAGKAKIVGGLVEEAIKEGCDPTEILNVGMIDAMGVVDAKRFIAIMNREKANYDDWRTSYFGKMTPEEYEKGLLEFEKNL